MDETLKVTNVLSDPTRFNIYQHLIENQEPVTVLDIAEKFDIHPNVARLHLSKLESIKLLVAQFQKTGRGGRPSRIYQLSDQVIELTFPHRDYKLLSSIMMETFTQLGDVGQEALYRTGHEYGRKIVEKNPEVTSSSLSTEQKLTILRSAGTMLGMYPNFEYDAQTNEIVFHIANCPFKEVASNNHTVVCNMHHAFLKGMLAALFTEDITLVEQENMFQGCNQCSYVAKF